MAQIKLMPTKAGKGFKAVDENGNWFYTSRAELFKAMNSKSTACVMRTIDEKATENVTLSMDVEEIMTQ